MHHGKVGFAQSRLLFFFKYKGKIRVRRRT